MADCDEGYRCRVCRDEVDFITDSELYLRYVIGEVDPELLATVSECHLQCNPILSQFIDDRRFVLTTAPPEGFAKELLDAEYCRTRTERVTMGYRRLWEYATVARRSGD